MGRGRHWCRERHGELPCVVSPPDESQPQGLSKSSSHLLYELLQVSKLPVPGPQELCPHRGEACSQGGAAGRRRLAVHSVVRRGTRGHRGGHSSPRLCSTAVKRVTQEVCPNGAGRPPSLAVLNPNSLQRFPANTWAEASSVLLRVTHNGSLT